MTNYPKRIIEEFVRRFGAQPDAIVRAPGRVNLIGEHTDYNDGFVLPLAIDLGVWVALRPRADRRVVVHSLQLPELVDFSLDERWTGSGWGKYVRGVARALSQAGYSAEGWEGVITSDLPIGAGLSSSAALEMACARAFSHVSPFAWKALAMAKIGQTAENQSVGVDCGIMDQIACAAGVAGHALLIDCRSLLIEPVPIPDGSAVVILDTGTRRELVGSAYNDRRASCKAAARLLEVCALRDVDAEVLKDMAGRLDEVGYRRARHVVTENARTLRAADAMRRNDAQTTGRLMNASHDSLRDDFDVSSSFLNAMVACAQEHEACFGARMTGAGFGGCVVALIMSAAADYFTFSVATSYEARTGKRAVAHICAASSGAELVVGS